MSEKSFAERHGFRVIPEKNFKHVTRHEYPFKIGSPLTAVVIALPFVSYRGERDFKDEPPIFGCIEITEAVAHDLANLMDEVMNKEGKNIQFFDENHTIKVGEKRFDYVSVQKFVDAFATNKVK